LLSIVLDEAGPYSLQQTVYTTGIVLYSLFYRSPHLKQGTLGLVCATWQGLQRLTEFPNGVVCSIRSCIDIIEGIIIDLEEGPHGGILRKGRKVGNNTFYRVPLSLQGVLQDG